MFELNQLRSFIAVATELNFHRAAERLNMTQPPLSRQIQMLEREVGVLLFDRTGNSTRLTAAGRRFFTEAQDILRRAEAAALSARRAESGEEGAVVLGFIPVATLGLLPQVVSILRQAVPTVDVILKEMQTIDQLEALPSGMIDLGIMRLPRDRSKMNFARLLSEPYMLAVHRDHPLADKDHHVVQDLHRQDFLMYAPSDGWYGYENLNGLFITHKVRPNFVQYFGQTLTMLSMVDANVGIALVPAAARFLGFPNVVLKPIEFPSPIRSEQHLGWSNATDEQPVVQRVREALIGAFEDANDPALQKPDTS